MAKQLVLSGNRVIAHGEDCFLSMGGTVICHESGRVYQNATVANVDSYPSDIDEVGYEYHAGAFIPCAPYGKGGGNLAVLCPNDCKSIKDSGISSENLGKTEIKPYWGSGDKEVSIQASFPPVFAVAFMPGGRSDTRYNHFALITPVGGLSVETFFSDSSGAAETKFAPLKASVDGNTITWGETGVYDGAKMALNMNEEEYTAVIFGRA